MPSTRRGCQSRQKGCETGGIRTHAATALKLGRPTGHGEPTIHGSSLCGFDRLGSDPARRRSRSGWAARPLTDPLTDPLPDPAPEWTRLGSTPDLDRARSLLRSPGFAPSRCPRPCSRVDPRRCLGPSALAGSVLAPACCELALVAPLEMEAEAPTTPPGWLGRITRPRRPTSHAASPRDPAAVTESRRLQELNRAM